MSKSYDNENGVWRTIGGRRVFIKSGQSVADAMKESGKFKSAKKEDNVEKNELDKEEKAKTINEAKDLPQLPENLTKHLDTHKGMDSFPTTIKGEDKYFSITQEEKEMLQDYVDKVDSVPEEIWRKWDEKEALDISTRANNADRVLRNSVVEEKPTNENKKLMGYEIRDGKKRLVERELRDTDRGYWTKENGMRVFKENPNYKETGNEFEVSELKKKALETLPKKDIDSHDSDLYIKKTKESTALLNNMKHADSGLLTTFRDEQTGETWYDIPFANMEDDYKEKTSNEKMNKKIRAKASKISSEPDLPKHVEIKSQGTSNRKEVSENIQAHILEHYDSPQDFLDQMDNVTWQPTNWHKGQQLAEDGFYEIYYDDQRKFLDDLKINPKGKDFDDSRVFETYKSLIGRESAKLYDRLKKNAYQQYKKEHPLTKMSFEEFKNQK